MDLRRRTHRNLAVKLPVEEDEDGDEVDDVVEVGISEKPASESVAS